MFFRMEYFTKVCSNLQRMSGHDFSIERVEFRSENPESGSEKSLVLDFNKQV